jgi:hypothetical protein
MGGDWGLGIGEWGLIRLPAGPLVALVGDPYRRTPRTTGPATPTAALRPTRPSDAPGTALANRRIPTYDGTSSAAATTAVAAARDRNTTSRWVASKADATAPTTIIRNTKTAR